MTEHNPAKANCGRALIYTENSMNYTITGNLNIYKERSLSALI